jgi:hypothetical protein
MPLCARRRASPPAPPPLRTHPPTCGSGKPPCPARQGGSIPHEATRTGDARLVTGDATRTRAPAPLGVREEGGTRVPRTSDGWSRRPGPGRFLCFCFVGPDDVSASSRVCLFYFILFYFILFLEALVIFAFNKYLNVGGTYTRCTNAQVVQSNLPCVDAQIYMDE